MLDSPKQLSAPCNPIGLLLLIGHFCFLNSGLSSQGRILAFDVIKMQGKGKNAFGGTTINNFDVGYVIWKGAGWVLIRHISLFRLMRSLGISDAGRVLMWKQNSTQMPQPLVVVNR
ncbi:hypothetical protein MKW98_026253 [Papaver atlanticum]|uniref:Uncharacterized protein n=1 Tax=Papaver atlanticum TaxID=357466 RepID=A0AAD4XH70_9MAGN|nr:hypothetical protein MKW98_026253 [Papaver atlanticum]